MSQKCQCIRTFPTPKVQPGKWPTRVCGRNATRRVDVFQEDEHPRKGTGWFKVWICDKCIQECAR